MEVLETPPRGELLPLDIAVEVNDVETQEKPLELTQLPLQSRSMMMNRMVLIPWIDEYMCYRIYNVIPG